MTTVFRSREKTFGEKFVKIRNPNIENLSRTEGRDPKQIQNPKNKIQNKEPANKEKLLSETSTALQPVLSADKLLQHCITASQKN
jgi:hypothetical protein